MRFYYKLPALFAIAALILIACNKNDSLTKTNGQFDVFSGKEWWYGNFRKTADYKMTDWASIFAPSPGSSTKKYPDWKKATSYKKFDFEIVEIPLFYQTNEILLLGMQYLNKTKEGERVARSSTHKLLLIKNANGKIFVRSVTIVPTAEYAAKKNYDISNVHPNDLPSDFDGYLMIASWDESEKNTVKIVKGKPVRKIKLLTREQMVKMETTFNKTESLICPDPVWVPRMRFACVVVPTGDAIADAETCEENGEWIDYGGYEYPPCYDGDDPDDPNGPGGLDDCLNSGMNIEECFCALYQLACGDPGGGDSPLPETINNVENPCIRAMVFDAISRDCQNKITNFVNTAFSTNEHFHLVFYDKPLGVIVGEDANTVCGPSGPVSNGDNKVTITLNNSPGTLNGASTEYIAITIFHEILHAWIDMRSTGPISEQASHELMATETNLNLMANALLEMYPNISPQDAIDMAWGGLSTTDAWAALTENIKNRIKQTNLDYKSQLKGTACTQL